MRRASLRGLAVIGPLLVAVSPAAAQVRVSAEWLYPVETVYIGDFSPYNVGQAPDFLGITLVNAGARAQTILLELTIERERPSPLFIFRGRTAPFVLSEPVRRVTNRDLASRGRDVSMTDYEIGKEAERTYEQIAQTGRFPSGTYVFALKVFTPVGAVLDETVVRLELTNPTRIELIAPGRPFGEPPPVVTTQAPRFVWSSAVGVGGGGQYRIRVVRVDAAASAEEAMQGFAAWEAVTRATTVLYPGSVNAIPLEPGASYAWQVTREIRTSGGVEFLASPIFWFRVAAPAGAAPLARSAASDDAAALEFAALVQRLGFGASLAGFRPTGQLLVDGRPVAPERLQDLIRAILAGEIAIRSVTVR